MDFVSILFTIMMLMLSTLLIFLDRKKHGYELILLHVIIMCFALYAGIAVVFPESAMFGLFVSLYGVASFFVDILTLEV